MPPPRKRRRSADGMVTMTSPSSSEEGGTTDINTNMRRSGGGYLTSRESALVLAGETITLAATHWLMEESYRDARTDRAFGALQYAAQLLTSPGRTNAGLVDSVRRALRAGVYNSNDICYEWTRYTHNDYESTRRKNYRTWDPAMTDTEWNKEKGVMRRIRDAIEHAVVHCEVTLYAPLATVIEKIAQASALHVQQI